MSEYQNNNYNTIDQRRISYYPKSHLGSHGILVVVLLGIALVAQKLLVNSTGRWETMRTRLLDAVAMVLLVLVVIGVVL